MKIMTPLLIALMSTAAIAQTLPPLDPARQAERDARDARDRGGWGRDDRDDRREDRRDRREDRRDNRGGGWGPVRPGPGRPPMPPPPRPRPPSYNDVYGPSYTARWQDYGTTKISKLSAENITIDVRGQYVNEILLRTSGNTAQIVSVMAYLSNGQVVDVRQATGNIGDGRELRVQLDYRASLRVERIVIQASSPNIIGSRAQLTTILGLAY